MEIARSYPLSVLTISHFKLTGQNRKKRQVPPAQVSPDDVIIIEPLRMVNGELLVSFVVGGQGGQSAPVSGTDVANLLEEEGPSLAMVLSNVVGCSANVYSSYVHEGPRLHAYGQKYLGNFY